MRFVTGVLSMMLAMLGTGCATLTGPKYERLQVTSNPPGAEVRVSGAPAGRTPVAVDLELSRVPSVEVEAPGYLPQQCRVRMSPGPGYIVADVVLCVLLFPIGCISFIDAMGAWNELDQRACNVNLAPGGAFGQPPAAYPPAGGYPPPPNTGSYPPAPPPAPGGGTAYPPPPPPM